MYLIKTVFLIVFFCFPLNSQENLKSIDLNSSIFSPMPLSSASCKADAEADLRSCLNNRPEREWGICERAYYSALSKC